MLARLNLFALLLLLLLFVTIVRSAEPDPDLNDGLFGRVEPTVSVDSGPIIGTMTKMPAATGFVAKFLGVPFAEKPQRFMPPAKPKAWDRPIRTQTWKSSCIQQFGNGAKRNMSVKLYNTPAAKESEDCLYLNVYAPSRHVQGRGRPVLFWLYGGNFQFGNAGQKQYDGSGFAAYQDVVIVTTNYRSNVFGFPGAPSFGLAKRNLGFWDQRLALDWVQRNIDVFGGDPDKVTIFGESSGAMSVDALLTSYAANERPPFRGAILQSGQSSYQVTKMNPAISEDSWMRLGKHLNCPTNNTLACLSSNNLTATKIRDAMESHNLMFMPIADNRTLVSAPALRRARYSIAKIPIMIGTGSQEGWLQAEGQNDVKKYVMRTFGNNTELAQAVLKAYDVEKTEKAEEAHDALAQIMTEASFQCSTALLANVSASTGIPSWRYYFNASFPNLNTPSDAISHVSETKLLFGTFSPRTASESPPEEMALAEFMQGAWARFAKDPWSGPGWTAVGHSPRGYDLGDIGNEGGVRMIRQSEVDERCGLYTPIYKEIAGIT